MAEVVAEEVVEVSAATASNALSIELIQHWRIVACDVQSSIGALWSIVLLSMRQKSINHFTQSTGHVSRASWLVFDAFNESV